MSSLATKCGSCIFDLSFATIFFSLHFLLFVFTFSQFGCINECFEQMFSTLNSYAKWHISRNEDVNKKKIHAPPHPKRIPFNKFSYLYSHWISRSFKYRSFRFSIPLIKKNKDDGDEDWFRTLKIHNDRERFLIAR